MKRKRRCQGATGGRPTKRHHATDANQSIINKRAATAAALPTIRHNVLSSCYPTVCTLRNYLLASLPASSRVRLKRLSAHGQEGENCILDDTLVGVLREPSISLARSRKDDFASFTQSQHRATGAFSGKTSRYSMNEVGVSLHFTRTIYIEDALLNLGIDSGFCDMASLQGPPDVFTATSPCPLPRPFQSCCPPWLKGRPYTHHFSSRHRTTAPQ